LHAFARLKACERDDMNTWDIVTKSVGALVDNIGAAARISGAIFVLTVFVSTTINVTMMGQLQPYQFDPEAVTLPPNAILATFLTTIFSMVAFTWVTVNWHRFILLSEDSNRLLPGWNARRIITYVLRSIGIALLISVFLIFISAIFLAFMSILGLGAFLNFMPFVMMIVFFYAFYRFGLILPAAALDEKFSFAKSLAQTAPLAPAIWGLAAVNFALTVTMISIASLTATESVIGVILGAAVQWVMILLSASFLTTLYAYCKDNPVPPKGS